MLGTAVCHHPSGIKDWRSKYFLPGAYYDIFANKLCTRAYSSSSRLEYSAPQRHAGCALLFHGNVYCLKVWHPLHQLCDGGHDISVLNRQPAPMVVQ